MDGRVILRIIWLPCALILVLAALYYWHSRSIARLDSIVSDKTEVLASKQKLMESVGDLKEKLAEFKRQVNAVDDDLFGLEEAVSLVKAVASTADRHKVKLIDFKYDIPKYIHQKKLAVDPGPFTVPFEITFAGDYNAVGRLLNSLETKIFVVDIYEIKLQNSREETGEVLCDIKGALRFFEKSRLEIADNGQ